MKTSKPRFNAIPTFGTASNCQKLRSIISILIKGMTLIGLVSCGHAPSMKARHTVLHPGQAVFFNTQSGSGKMEHAGEFERNIVLSGETYRVKFIQRPQEFEHQLGIYSLSQRAEGMSRSKSPQFLIQESEIYFSSESELNTFLKKGAHIHQWVDDGRGLLLCFFSSPAQNVISLGVYRIFINEVVTKKIPRDFRSKGTASISKITEPGQN